MNSLRVQFLDRLDILKINEKIRVFGFAYNINCVDIFVEADKTKIRE